MNCRLKCKKKYIKLLENENTGHSVFFKTFALQIPCKEAGKASYR